MSVTLFTDTFTGTAGTNLTSHPADSGESPGWVKNSGFSGVIELTGGGNVYGTSTGTVCYYVANITPLTNEYFITATLKFNDQSSDYASLVLRSSATVQTHYRVTFDPLGNWEIVRSVGGTDTDLYLPATYTATAGSTHTVVFGVTSDSDNNAILSLSIDGTQVAIVKDWATPSSLQGIGQAGIDYYYSVAPTSSNGVQIGSFSVATNTPNQTSAATAYSLYGPALGITGTASSNFTVSLTPHGTTQPSGGSVTVTPSASGVTFSPSAVTLTTSSPSATFTATSSAAGRKVISTTNNQGITDPSAVVWQVNSATVNVVCDGNSLVYGFNVPAEGNYPSILADMLGNGATVTNDGISSQTTTEIYSPPNTRLGGGTTFSTGGTATDAYNSSASYNLYVLWEATNDVGVGTTTAAQAKTDYTDVCAHAAALGYVTIVCDIIPRIAAQWPANAQTQGPAFNTQFQSDWSANVRGLVYTGGTYANYGVDLASDTIIHPSGTLLTSPSLSDSRVYYAAGSQPSGIHLTTYGYTQVATDIMAAVLTATGYYVTAATAFTLSGPSSGVLNAASANFTFTPNGTYTGTATPTDSSGEGSFSPSSLTYAGGSSAETFTYTPSTPGARNINAVATGLTASVSIVYTSLVVSATAALTTETYALTGSDTSWSGAPFTLVSGPSGCTLSAQTVTDTTHAVLTFASTTGAIASAITISDGTNTFAIRPPAGSGGDFVGSLLS